MGIEPHVWILVTTIAGGVLLIGAIASAVTLFFMLRKPKQSGSHDRAP